VPVLRAREIDRWAASNDYYRLVKGAPVQYEDSSKGGWRNW
jgi:hypothetical protein